VRFWTAKTLEQKGTKRTKFRNLPFFVNFVAFCKESLISKLIVILSNSGLIGFDWIRSTAFNPPVTLTSDGYTAPAAFQKSFSRF
jgi:hypothetical protein